MSSDLVDPNQLGRRQQSTQTVTIDSTAKKVANTFGSANLWLGKFDNIESRILIRFAKLNLPDTVAVVAGTLKLITNLVQGQGASFDATIHEVTATTAWDSAKITWGEGNFPVEFNATPMDIQHVSSEKTDSVIFKLDPAVVSSWRTTGGREKGVMIQAPTATFTKAFYSQFNLTKTPVFQLITLKKGNTKNDTTNLSASASVFVFQRMAELRNGPIYIGLGEQNQSTFFFDVTAIPRNATISHAVMTVEVDTLNSVFYSSRLDVQLSYIGPLKIENYNLNPLRFEPFGSYLDTLRIADLDTVSVFSKQIIFTVTNAVQQWVLDAKNNFGLILFPISPIGRDLTRAAFYSRKTDVTRAPKLQIEYTVPPQ